MSEPQKKLPNILICGTPGCGKTQHAEALKEKLNFKFFNIAEMVKDNKYYERFAEEYQSYIMDDDKVLDDLEGPIAQGGCLVDHHTCDFFPERFFQLVVVLHCDNSILFDRLSARGYAEAKVRENVQAEIMDVVGEMADESYAPEVVVSLQSDTDEQLQDNVQRILLWIQAYMESEDEDQEQDQQE